MRILHRYVFRQVLGAALLGILFFVFVLVMGNAMRDIFDKLASAQISWGTFFYFFCLIIPKVIPYALPLGLLTAIMIVMGRMSAQHEITAARASGVSILSIAAPIFWIGIIGVVLSGLLNIYYSPLADTLYKKRLYNLIRENPLHFIKPKTFIDDFPGYILYVTERDDEELTDFWIWELDDDKRVNVFIKGQRGEFVFDEADELIVFKVFDGTAEKRPSQDPEQVKDSMISTVSFEELAFKLPLDDLLGGGNFNRKLGIHTLEELLEKRDQAIVDGDFRYQIKIQLEIQKKWAMAFSVFSLAFIAIPLSVKVGRTEKSVNVLLALAMSLLYYAFLVVLSWTEQIPHWRPDLLIWLPNLVFQSIGAWMLLKMRK